MWCDWLGNFQSRNTQPAVQPRGGIRACYLYVDLKLTHLIRHFLLFLCPLVCICELGSAVSIVSDYGMDDQAIDVRFLEEAKGFFPLAFVSRPALGPTQPPVQWVPKVFLPGAKRSRGVTLSAHPNLVLRLRMSRNYTSCPPKHLHVM
jgi:hypothetical protein